MLDLSTYLRLAAPVADRLGASRDLELPLLPGAGEAALAWALAAVGRQPVLLVTDGARTLEERHQDLVTLRPVSDGRPAGRLHYFPAADAPGVAGEPDADLAGCRLQTLRELGMAGGAPDAPTVIATSVQALMQTTISPDALAQDTVALRVGGDAEPDALAEQLVRLGYRSAPEVAEKGALARRGGLLDVWPPTEPWPLRIEFAGAKVESLRSFDPESQRSRARMDAVAILPAREPARAGRQGAGGTAFDHFPAPLTVLWADRESIAHHAGLFAELAEEEGAGGRIVSLAAVRRRAAERNGGRQVWLTAGAPADAGAGLDIRPVQGVFHLPREDIEPDFLETVRRRLYADLLDRAARGQDVSVCFDTPGAKERFESQMTLPATAAARGVALRVGVLSTGFCSDPAGVVVVSESDLYGRRKPADRRYLPDANRPRAARGAGLRVAELTDIEPDDYVVHVEHGIGRYEGLQEILFDGVPQEVLTIEYAEGARLHVPVSQAHLLSRYVGLSRRRVELHRLGGRRWSREKQSAERGVADLAASLLEIQAQRNLLDGTAFPADAPWQHEFEASFPYRETPDQSESIAAVKRDMESSRPMDRLICGDAGYGKTEVAMRAVFKAVMSGRQAAVLVPTTVLAQQHYRTFSLRMAAYPVQIEMLCRLVTRAQQQRTLRGLADGSVDVVIGTHALLQPGLRFHDLGLVVVDEEQRFGVAHKERLKTLRRLVDVLTLTATPIPRTLYMSLTGARDMSLLQTPPGERMPIETVVAKDEDRVVREAVLRELNREGQVFYLYNRILTIERARARLARLVPECRVCVAHGQMSARELADAMRRFAAGEFDVLLSTTIVETGVDVPRANTILIDRADRFGIADLYQLRGRVGRANRKAYAYLLLPPGGVRDPDARDRIGAVKKFSGLGAGFSLALRDLEIRGAGNLLGAEQSGHVTAVGFGLYCQLLRRTVAQMQGAPVPPLVDVRMALDFVDLSPASADPSRAAFLPFDYIEEERPRIAAYRRLAELADAGEVARLREEWRDRYGPLPPPAERLLRIAEIRVAAAARGLAAVETREGKILLTREGELLTRGGRLPRLRKLATDARLCELRTVVQEA